MTPEDIFVQLFSDTVEALCIRLLEKARLPQGFEAQEIGLREASTASSGTIVYAISSIHSVPDSILYHPISQLEGWIHPDGSIVAHHFRDSDVKTPWASSQCLLALCQRPHLITSNKRVTSLARHVLFMQNHKDGGWGHRPRASEPSHPIFCIYPLLALIKACEEGFVDSETLMDSMELLKSFVEQYLKKPGDSTSLLLATYILFRMEKAFNGFIPADILNRSLELAEKRSVVKNKLSLSPITVTSESQPLWHVVVNAPLLYLCTRLLWPPTFRTSAMLAQSLLDSYDVAEEGWRNRFGTARVYSWTTGLGILAAYLFCVDLSKFPLTIEQWKRRARTFGSAKRAYDFDVAISFSSAQRGVAERIYSHLKEQGLDVFYDWEYQHELMGEDLAVYLQKTYFRRSRYAVAVLSKDFVKSKWGGNWEWPAILARMQQQKKSYLLPYYWEEVDVPGLNPTIGYISSSTHSPEQFADLVARKLLFSSVRLY